MSLALALALAACGRPAPPAFAAPGDAADALPPSGPNEFPLFPCRASVLDPNADQNVAAQAAPEAGQYLRYGATPVELRHDNNCWSPSQLQRMGNHRALSDITEVVIHWTALDYPGSVYALERGVSVHYLVPLAADPSRPALEMVDPRNAAWHAGPLNMGLWEDAAHLLCVPGESCRPNGNVHSIGFENVGSATPNSYQVGVMADIIATLVAEGYPIRLDPQHVVGHKEINRYKSDPGNLDIAHLIQMTRDKILLNTPPPQPAVPPTPTAPALPPASVADGSAANPFPFVESAYGQLPGDSGGAYVYYTFAPNAGTSVTLHFSYTGMAAPAGAVGLAVYQGTTKLTALSPPGNQNDAAVTFSAPAGAPVVVQVFSYVPQTVNWQMYTS